PTPRWLTTSLALATLALTAGCGADPLPEACTRATTADILGALERAPDDGRLPDGTALSGCVDGATDDAELQALGLRFVAVADRLAAAIGDDPDAAFQLGYLIGAAERGAGPTGGGQAELVRRLRQVVSFQRGLERHRDELVR